MQASQEHNGHKTWLSKLVTMTAALLLASPILIIPHYALAQERQTLFQWLFGPKQPSTRYSPQKNRPQSSNQRPRNRTEGTKRAKTNQATPTIVRKRNAVPVPVEKLDTAKTVLVFGDFMASALGDGLSSRFESNASIRVETEANGSSGVVRNDYYDWPVRLTGFMGDFKPMISVVMIGSNDRQSIKTAQGEFRFGSPEWFAEYEKRLDNLATLAKSNGSKLIWVGLPSFQSPSFTADVLVLNRLYRTAAEKAGGEFVDIWDGFTDEAGKFITTGFDSNGQQARLREADGIALTPSGREKLAFYVERAISRYIDAGGTNESKLDGSNLPSLTALPDMGVNASEIRTQPINVSDPELDGGKELLDNKQLPIALTESPRQRLVVRGEMDEAPLGRVDDYRPTTSDPLFAIK